MSVVHNYILLLPCGEDHAPRIAALNAAASAFQSRHEFKQVDGAAGGYKAFEADVFMLAGNYLPLADMAAAIVATDWGDDAEQVQLCHQGQEDELFKLYGWQDLQRIASGSVLAP